MSQERPDTHAKALQVSLEQSHLGPHGLGNRSGGAADAEEPAARAGEAGREEMTPPVVAELIKRWRLLGYRAKGNARQAA